MKYIKIKECSECKYFDELYDTENSCWIMACINSWIPNKEFPRKIENVNEIPVWCPLPELPTNINQEIRDEVKNIIS